MNGTVNTENSTPEVVHKEIEEVHKEILKITKDIMDLCYTRLKIKDNESFTKEKSDDKSDNDEIVSDTL